MCNEPRVLFSKTACILLALWGVQARADEIPPMPPAPDSLLVGDMLRIDADRARAAELAKGAAISGVTMPDAAVPALGARTLVIPSPSQGNVEPVLPLASLSAIYGVGQQLYADVRIHGHAVTYAAGRAQPIRTSQAQTAYRLRAIRPPCVQLDAQDARIKSAAPALELCLGDKP